MIIKENKDLKRYIENNGDYNPEINYFSVQEDGGCFALFGCTHASEAFKLCNSFGQSLAIVGGDYSQQIATQSSSDSPELEPIYLNLD